MSITEKITIKLFNDKFGSDLLTRFIKLDEEYNELQSVLLDYRKSEVDAKEHLIDELSDTLSLITHIASILEISLDELLLLAIIKVKVREHYPSYKK